MGTLAQMLPPGMAGYYQRRRDIQDEQGNELAQTAQLIPIAGALRDMQGQMRLRDLAQQHGGDFEKLVPALAAEGFLPQAAQAAQVQGTLADLADRAAIRRVMGGATPAAAPGSMSAPAPAPAMPRQPATPSVMAGTGAMDPGMAQAASDQYPAQPAASTAAPRASAGFDARAEADALRRKALELGRIGPKGAELAKSLLEQAKQLDPEEKFGHSLQIGKDPTTGQLSYFAIGDRGTIRKVDIGIKPDIEMRDIGGKVVAVDKNATSAGTEWAKTLTPGEILTDQRTRSEGAASRAVTMRGQNLADARAAQAQDRPIWDTERGVFISPRNATATPVVDADGKPIGPKDKDAPEALLKAAGYATRMQEADKVLSRLETTAGKPGVGESMLGRAPMAGNVAANLARGPERQQYFQAAEDWVRAKLRQESGAVIADEEMAREIRTYFPQIGDSEQVIAQKAAARKTAEQAMVTAAGRALRQPHAGGAAIPRESIDTPPASGFRVIR